MFKCGRVVIDFILKKNNNYYNSMLEDERFEFLMFLLETPSTNYLSYKTLGMVIDIIGD